MELLWGFIGLVIGGCIGAIMTAFFSINQGEDK